MDAPLSPGQGASMKGDVELGDSVWIGAGVVLLPGTSIGAGPFASAPLCHSLMLKIPPYHYEYTG